MGVVLSQRSERHQRLAVLREFLDAALLAADPKQAVRRAMQRQGHLLVVDGQTLDLRPFRRVLVVGAGKAAAAMAQEVEEILERYLTSGVVAVKRGYAAPTRKVEVVEGGHPLPDEKSLAAAQQVLALMSDVSDHDLVICLLSGGASALVALPSGQVTLRDKRAITDSLLRSGATVNELNCVRKHLSLLKGGGLARFAQPARVVSLILSDVVGSPLDVIASGPTVPDPSTYQDALRVLGKYGLLEAAPAVARHLRRGADGQIAETPKAGDPAFERTINVVVASNVSAVEAAVQAARQKGFNSMLLSTCIEGEAREVGRVFAAIAKEMVSSGRPLPRPACLVAGGETTVTVRGQGKGGRNQELLLAAALQIDGWQGVSVASVATDGMDGPTCAAGAYAEGTTLGRGAKAGRDARFDLANNDSYSFFCATGDLIVTGPTNANVNDLIFVLAF